MLSITELRTNLYKLIDQVIESGEPLEIERKGQVVVIAAPCAGSKFDALIPREGVLQGDPDDFIHIDWSEEWRLPE